MDVITRTRQRRGEISFPCSRQGIEESNQPARAIETILNSHQFCLRHQNLAKLHHLSSGAKDLKALKYINTDIREQNIYNYD